MQVSGSVQIIRMMALMDAGHSLAAVFGSEKKRLKGTARFSGLENAAVTIILAKRVVAHIIFILAG